MKIVKKVFDKLWLILAVVGTVSAMDIAPFFFANASGQDAETQEAEWNYLMKYKMFGASGIKFENGNIRVTDSVGWFGTSHGNLSFQNGDDSIGGPILIGGDIDIKMGPEVFVNGPVNVTGNILVGQETNFASKPNEFHGHQCVQGDVPSVYASLIGNEYKHFGVEGTASVNSNNGYKDCLDTTKGLKVPEVRNNLYIPELNTAPTYSTELKTRVTNLNTLSVEEKTGSVTAVDVNNQIYEIYIPEGDPQEPFDIYLDHITLTNDATLLFNMQDGGRLTRIFLNGSISFSSTTNIAVQYDTLSNGTYIRQENEDYNGTLLFYTTKDISFQSTNQNSHPSLQGSILTTGTIVINDHIKLAGQLLADIIRINYNFDGSNFIFVPFNPTILDFDPTALAEGKFIENNQTVLVPIKLDTLASVDVSFKYCFDIKDSSLTDPNSKIASIQDFNNITPVCGKDTGSVKILMGDTVPRGDYNVYINVAIDTLFEGQETLPMKVFSLAGAVLPGNKRQGSFSLPIIDDPTPASLKKIVLDSVPENSPVGTPIDSLIAIRGDKLCTHCKFALVDSTDYVNVSETGLVTVKDSSILDYETITEIQIRVFVIDTLYQKISDTTVTIPVINVNENPILQGDDFDVDEHKPAKTIVGTIKGDDIDKVDSFRNNVFEAVGGDTLLFAVDSTGVITTKKELDYETMDTTYILVVKLRDHKDTSLYAIDTMTIHVHNVNENPKITTDTLYVTENSPKGTDVGEIKATDPDKNDTQTFTLVNDPSGCFDVASDGSVTVSEKCKGIDREKDPVIVIEVQVTDSFGATDIHKIRVVVKDVPSPKIEVTDTTWTKPKEPIYTNDSNFPYCWILNSKKEDGNCADTTLKPGKNEICKEVCDLAGFEGCAEDCMTVYYSDAAPVVTVSAESDEGSATNIFTIVEKTDDADTNVYVNKTQNDIRITVKDSVTGVSKNFTVNVDLKNTVKVPQKTYDELASVIKEAPALDEDAKGAVRTPVNGTEVSVSYTTKVAGAEVNISYLTDNKGNVVKQTVINDKGKEESIAVMEVSYETEIDGKKVTVSYYADAVTGSLLVKDAYGRLMTESAASAEKVDAGVYSVSYNNVNAAGDSVTISYAVDKKGEMVKNSNGDIGYSVSYTYMNEYGNSAKRSIFMVLDQKGPEVEILSPVWGAVIRSNSVAVEWTVDGKVQDTLVVQGLEKGINYIVRYYCDKAGNKASDTVFVMMKDGKDVNVSIEKPVTVVTKDRVSEYYKDESSRPKPGQTYAVSIQKPTLDGDGEEVETLIGGTFGSRAGSGEEPYKNVSKKNATHLGPTLALDIKLPTVSDGNNHGSVGGLATLDDLMSGNLIPLEGVDAANSKKVSVEEYVAKYCEAGFDASDIKRANLYRTHAKIKIWVYTTLGNFVDYYSFSQDLNDPDYTNEAGMLRMFFEMKPDADGNVRSEKGKLYATGAYVYKVEAKLRSDLRCTLPPVDDVAGKKMGDVIKSDDDLLKPFGYKRPAKK